jgi:hypothetical protein
MEGFYGTTMPSGVIHLFQVEEDGDKVYVHRETILVWCSRFTRSSRVDIWKQNLCRTLETDLDKMKVLRHCFCIVF